MTLHLPSLVCVARQLIVPNSQVEKVTFTMGLEGVNFVANWPQKLISLALVLCGHSTAVKLIKQWCDKSAIALHSTSKICILTLGWPNVICYWVKKSYCFVELVYFVN